MLNGTLVQWAKKTGIQRLAKGYLPGFHYIKKTRIHNVEVNIPSLAGVTCNASEPWMLELLGKLLAEQAGTFLDVGVNLGQTLVKVKVLDPQREYIGFEPNPRCVGYVQELIKANAFANCTLLPVGLFTEDCVLALEMFSDSATDASATLIRNFRPDHPVRSRVFVPVFRFNSLAQIFADKVVGIIKIDVEGAELEVIESLLDRIKRDQPIILMEVLPVHSAENDLRQQRQIALERLLAKAEYTLLRVKKSASNTFAGLTRIESIGIHSDLTQCDYVAVPNQRLAALQLAHDAIPNRPAVPVGQAP